MGVLTRHRFVVVLDVDEDRWPARMSETPAQYLTKLVVASFGSPNGGPANLAHEVYEQARVDLGGLRENLLRVEAAKDSASAVQRIDALHGALEEAVGVLEALGFAPQKVPVAWQRQYQVERTEVYEAEVPLTLLHRAKTGDPLAEAELDQWICDNAPAPAVVDADSAAVLCGFQPEADHG